MFYGKNGGAAKGEPEIPAHLAHKARNAPELRAIIHAWPDLPDAIKAGILAMVRSAGGAA